MTLKNQINNKQSHNMKTWPLLLTSPSPIHIPANKNFKSKNRESKLKLLIWNDNIH